MKLEDCKKGTLVIAHKKRFGISIEFFLKEFPLGTGKIRGTRRVDGRPLIILKGNYGKTFIFSPEELKEVK